MTLTSPDTALLIERGLNTCEGLVVTPEIRRFVEARAETALAATDPTARMADIVLAAGCANGDPSAISSFDRTLANTVRPALARIGLPASEDDEITQRVRVAMLVPSTSETVGIAGYSGRGELKAYIRSVAVKIALKRLERETGPSIDDETEALEMMPDADDTPAMRVVKERCRGDVRAAFGAAFAALEPSERTLLRQHYIDGLTIDVLGQLHGVHRATCARWIESARSNVLHGVIRYMRQTHGLTEAELELAVELVRSQLDLSMSRHLFRSQ